MFYTFGRRRDQGPAARKKVPPAGVGGYTFVEIIHLPIHGKVDNLFVLSKTDYKAVRDTRLNNFTRQPAGATQMVFVDTIRFKIKIMPHCNDVEDKLMGIRMWEAR